jgi:hypothetical protein
VTTVTDSGCRPPLQFFYALYPFGREDGDEAATLQVTAVNARIAYAACDYNSSIEFTASDIWTMNPDGSASELPPRRRPGDD